MQPFKYDGLSEKGTTRTLATKSLISAPSLNVRSKKLLSFQVGEFPATCFLHGAKLIHL